MSGLRAFGHQSITASLVEVSPPCIAGHLPTSIDEVGPCCAVISP
ncbi:hypothetical protein [Soonwooa sp.]|nr:hypothetical protein [Soonwooa sp.]